jgi:Flp pilus assembly protein TadG
MMGFIRSWFREEDGVTAVEFSLVATPFVFMMIGIIEMSLMFAAQSLLEASTTTAARLIRTGQIQQSGGDQEQLFRDAVCNFAEILIPCDDIQFQVTDMGDFGDAEEFPPAEFDEDGNLMNQNFSAGGSSDVVMIRVAYRYPIMTPLMQPMLTNDASNERVMMSTVVLQTEPYDFEG